MWRQPWSRKKIHSIQLSDGHSHDAHNESERHDSGGTIKEHVETVRQKKGGISGWVKKTQKYQAYLRQALVYGWIIPISIVSFSVVYYVDRASTVSHVFVHMPVEKYTYVHSLFSSAPKPGSQEQFSLDIKGLEILHDSSMVLINTAQLVSYLEKRNPHIKNINLKKEWPRNVHIYFKYRKPLAYVQGSGGLFVVDVEGRVLDKHKEIVLQIPLIKHYQQFHILSHQEGHHPFPSDIITTLYFVHSAEQNGFNIQNVDIKASDMIILYSNEHEYVFTVDKDKKTQEYQFLRVAKQYDIEGNYYKRIDVRFDKPLVVRW